MVGTTYVPSVSCSGNISRSFVATLHTMVHSVDGSLATLVIWICAPELYTWYYKKGCCLHISWDIRHIYREFNQTADTLSNQAIDERDSNGFSAFW